MEQLEGYKDPKHPNRVCHLKKTQYGLKQSNRGWNLRLHRYLVRKGFKQTASDGSVYAYRRGAEVAYLTVYVDDTLIIGSSMHIVNAVKGILASEFKMTDLGASKFFLGVQTLIDTEAGRIILHQQHYILRLLENST